MTTARPGKAYLSRATIPGGHKAPRHWFVPAQAQCNQNITLSDARSAWNPAVTGTATLTSFTSFNGSGTLPIDGAAMTDGQTSTHNVSAVVDGGSSGGTITNCAGINGPNTSITLMVVNS